MIICGWIFFLINGLDCLRNFLVNNIIDVVLFLIYKLNNKFIYVFGFFNIVERDVFIIFYILFKEV